MTDNEKQIDFDEQKQVMLYEEQRRQLYLAHSRANLPIYISDKTRNEIQKEILKLNSQENVPIHLLVLYEALSILPLTNNSYVRYVQMLKDIHTENEGTLDVKGFIFEVKDAKKQIQKEQTKLNKAVKDDKKLLENKKKHKKDNEK